MWASQSPQSCAVVFSRSPEPSCSDRPIDLSCPFFSSPAYLTPPPTRKALQLSSMGRSPSHSLTCALTLAQAFPFSHTYNLADLTQRHVLTGSHTFSHLTQLQSLTQTIMMASSFPFFQPQFISPLVLWVRSSYVRPPVTLHCLLIGTGAWHWHSRLSVNWLQLSPKHLLWMVI